MVDFMHYKAMKFETIEFSIYWLMSFTFNVGLAVVVYRTCGFIPDQPDSSLKHTLFDSGSVEIPGLLGGTVTSHLHELECTNILN